MVAVTFAAMGVVACAFLIYVLVHTHREFVNTGEKHYRGSKLSDVDLRRVERALKSARLSLHAGEKQQTKPEAAVRREILIGGILGLFGLLAPFIFVMVTLLNSSGAWHH